MHFGANTFIWASPFSTTRHLTLVEKVREMGFDLFEVAVEDPQLVEVSALKSALAVAGLGGVVCGVFGPGRNLSSLDPQERKNAAVYLNWLIDAAAEIEPGLVCGPMYSAVGKAHLDAESDRRAEWNLAVEGLQRASAYAASKGVKLAIEMLNRFETDMVNVVDQGLALIDAVGAPNLGLHLDTFHMHLEEKDSARAVRKAGSRVFHVHASENDRGVPGSGQVRWAKIFTALAEIRYTGGVVIESFTPEVKTIARAVCLWREVAPSQDAVAAEGLAFLKSLPGNA
jgi:D-psicose/D-tagatose/L-ribulose 3-epimerase